MKIPRVSILLFLFATAFLTFTFNPAHGQAAPVFSSVSISPVNTGGPSYVKVNSTFHVNVMLDLVSTENINGFDIRINYTSPQVILRPGSLNYSNNIFKGLQTLVQFQCIDGLSLNTSQSCPNRDTLGTIHLQEIIVGPVLPGPITAGLLFSVGFKVVGNGTSTFTFDVANISNPLGPNSQSNPHLVPVVQLGGVFANKGLISFFNFEPTTSQALLPGEPVRFDATGSFDADNLSITIRTYSWDFGDGTRQNVTSQVYDHPFIVAGNYTVTLSITNARGQVAPPIQLTVSVVRALGAISIALRTNSGSLTNPVTVKIFNSSSSVIPFSQVLSLTTVMFTGLTPGSYLLKFSGLGVVDYSQTVSVSAGLTTPDSVFLTLIVPPQSNVALFFYGALGVVVAGLSMAIVIKQVRRRKTTGNRRANRR